MSRFFLNSPEVKLTEYQKENQFNSHSPSFKTKQKESQEEWSFESDINSTPRFHFQQTSLPSELIKLEQNESKKNPEQKTDTFPKVYSFKCANHPLSLNGDESQQEDEMQSISLNQEWFPFFNQSAPIPATTFNNDNPNFIPVQPGRMNNTLNETTIHNSIETKDTIWRINTFEASHKRSRMTPLRYWLGEKKKINKDQIIVHKVFNFEEILVKYEQSSICEIFTLEQDQIKVGGVISLEAKRSIILKNIGKKIILKSTQKYLDLMIKSIDDVQLVKKKINLRNQTAVTFVNYQFSQLQGQLKVTNCTSDSERLYIQIWLK